MKGNGGRLFFGDKEIGKMVSWSINLHDPKAKECLVERSKESMSFRVFCSDKPLNFKIGNIYHIKDKLTGLQFKAKYIENNNGSYEFKMIGVAEVVQ